MKILNCDQFKEMLVSGANNLANRKEDINKLNVFPVPDGDTGTNMFMTFGSGVDEASKAMSEHIGEVAKILGKNMLMGARGNSGVILSQIFKGFYRHITDKESVNVVDIADGFANGAKIAYRAVMKPVEGTILTVCRESSNAGVELVKENREVSIEDYFRTVYEEAQASLLRTPELLPVLKEADVVDSGGAGYVAIIEGFYRYLIGDAVKLDSEEGDESDEHAASGYCVEVKIALNGMYKKAFDPEKLKTSLSKTCEVINIAKKAEEAICHVHTMTPGEVVTISQKFGDLLQIKIENLAISHNVVIDTEKKIEHVKDAIIAVTNGDGIKETFESLGVNYFISGGQTMNPATEDFVSLITSISADNIYILPNNSNIIMAANQAQRVLRKNYNIKVIPSTTIPEGMAACVAFNGEEDCEANFEMMTEAAKATSTGEVTTAVKNTTFNNVAINQGDYMGIKGKEIVISCPDLMTTTRKLLESLITEDSSYVTVIYGLQASAEQANEITAYIQSAFDVDCQLINGGQDLYPFIIGVE